MIVPPHPNATYAIVFSCPEPTVPVGTFYALSSVPPSGFQVLGTTNGSFSAVNTSLIPVSVHLTYICSV